MIPDSWFLIPDEIEWEWKKGGKGDRGRVGDGFGEGWGRGRGREPERKEERGETEGEVEHTTLVLSMTVRRDIKFPN